MSAVGLDSAEGDKCRRLAGEPLVGLAPGAEQRTGGIEGAGDAPRGIGGDVAIVRCQAEGPVPDFGAEAGGEAAFGKTGGVIDNDVAGDPLFAELTVLVDAVEDTVAEIPVDGGEEAVVVDWVVDGSSPEGDGSEGPYLIEGEGEAVAKRKGAGRRRPPRGVPHIEVAKNISPSGPRTECCRRSNRRYPAPASWSRPATPGWCWRWRCRCRCGCRCGCRGGSSPWR